MPKVPSTSSPPTGCNGGSVLKRNQACHQCRRRKLHSDAKRPCSTCVRSHSHAVAHAQPEAQLPPYPECTFDEVAGVDPSGACSETPKTRYERLESRICVFLILSCQDLSSLPIAVELEALLKQKEDGAASSGSPSDSPAPSASSANLKTPDISSPPANLSSSTSHIVDSFNVNGLHIPIDPNIMGGDLSMFEMLNGGAMEDNMLPPRLGILWPHWPPHLPRPDLLRHIVEAFFVFHPHATRLLNMSSFMASLSLPPDHPDFPSPPVLHAICAVGSMYTIAANSQEPSSDDTHHLSDADKSDSSGFAEQQAAYAKEQIDKYLVSGRRTVQCLQANVILSWYYWSHAKWVELFACTGQSLRVSVPLGLNLCPPFHALNTTVQSMSIIPAAHTVVEDETRRNTFWLAYAIDRQHGAGNGWALSLDDDDIAQLLPAPQAKLDAGIPVKTEARQWSHFEDTFLIHPLEITDSFTLYIKSMMIISRIKTFNLRFRVKENLGDPGSLITRTTWANVPDIRSAPTFRQLEDLVTSFRSSFPNEFKDPFLNGCMDTHLYTAHLTLHASIILLHEPHSNTKSSICTSAMKILHAARGILDLIYAVWSTNHDIGLLDLFCPFCWYLAGRVFGRFLKAAQDANSIQQIETLQGELEFIRMALGKIGERIPLSSRYQKMLDVCIVEVCGPSVDITVPVNGVPVRTVADDSLLGRVAQTSMPSYDLGTFMKLYNGFTEDA
ncbi:hypothetical protein HYDPIDRAFT_146307 [Hydnomerulius pinastri MD-312]|nr:hypothetical protein HYDPIDRAFT_146307 [Hydnomerulius pinastri MD-312]